MACWVHRRGGGSSTHAESEERGARGAASFDAWRLKPAEQRQHAARITPASPPGPPPRRLQQRGEGPRRDKRRVRGERRQQAHAHDMRATASTGHHHAHSPPNATPNTTRRSAQGKTALTLELLLLLLGQRPRRLDEVDLLLQLLAVGGALLHLGARHAGLPEAVLPRRAHLLHLLDRLDCREGGSGGEANGQRGVSAGGQQAERRLTRRVRPAAVS